MNIRFISIILLSLALGMTSCTPDDVSMTDNEQTVTATDTSDSSPEHEGDDEELEPNN